MDERRPPLISSRKFRHGLRDDQPALLHPRRRRLHPHRCRQRAVGPEIFAWPRQSSACLPSRSSNVTEVMIRSRPAHRRYVPPARLCADRSEIACDPRRPAHQGGRGRVFSGGVSMARASCQLLRKTENPEGNVWSPPNWDVPAPSDIAAPTDPRLGMNGKWTTRPIVGAMGDVGPRRLWMSEVRDLVEGVPLTPFVRVAVAADFASPWANAGDHGPRLHQQRRDAVSAPAAGQEWIGFEAVNHHASDGIAIGECWLLRPARPDRHLHCSPRWRNASRWRNRRRREFVAPPNLSFVMAGHSRLKDGVASLACVAAIHVLGRCVLPRRGCPGQPRA